MRYQILKPIGETFDPREYDLKSAADLYSHVTSIADLDSEQQAADYTRHILPNATVMPIPIEVGSGQTVLLGFINDEQARRIANPDREIPFVLFVQAISTNDADRHRIKRGGRGGAFDRLIWKVRPVRPEMQRTFPVELRATDLEVPTFTDAKVGYHDGKLTMYVEVGGIEMSLTFQQLGLVLNESESPATVPVDGGSSELDRIGSVD